MRKSLVKVRHIFVVVILTTLISTNAQAAAELIIERTWISGGNPVVSYDDVVFHYIVRNDGDEESSRFTVTCYLSDDEDYTADDYELGVEGGGPLQPGETELWGGWFDIPTDVYNGDYYIGIVVEPWDGTTVLTETADVVTVVRPTDLSVNSVDVDAAVRPGDQLDVSVSIHNDGFGVSDSFIIECYIDEHFIGSDNFGPLNPGDSCYSSVSCYIPDDIPDDDYYVRVVVSCPHDENSSNDEGESDLIWIGASMDIVVQSVQITSGAYLPGEKFVITTLLENTGERNLEHYVIDYYMSTDSIIQKNDYHLGSVNRSGLTAGEKESCEMFFHIPFSLNPGIYYAGIIVTAQDEDDPSNNVGHSSATIEIVHPAGYVCGNAEYQYRNHQNWTFPIRCALVQLFKADDNDDPLDDPLIASTHTDPNGNYAFTLSNNTDNGSNIYVKILTEGVSGAFPGTTSKICTLKDNVLDEIYSLVSDVYPHPGNASVVINMRAPGGKEGGEFMVFDSIVEGFIKAKTFMNIEMEEVSVYWPSEAETSYFDPCDTGLYISQGDRGDRDVIMHEYGHYIAEIYGIAQGSVGENPTHYWDQDLRYEPTTRSDEEAMNLAFREAWASLYSIATQYDDQKYPYAGDSRYNDIDEEGSWTLDVDLDNEENGNYWPGQYFENMNAGTLWDIFDDRNKEAKGSDTLSDLSLEKIWTISRDYKPENILDFWNSWFKKYDYEQELKSIFEAHEMSFDKP